MTLHVRDGGTWKESTAPAVRDGGTWKNLKEGWVRDGGTWKQFFNALSFLIGSRTISGAATSPSTAFASIAFRNTGALQGTTSDLGTETYAGEWMNPLGGDTPGNYSVRATQVSTSGSATRTGTLGTWLNLGTEREWQISTSSFGVKNWVLTFEIRRDSDSTVVASGGITLEAEAV